MMAKNVEEIARRLGARVVATDFPETGGGVFGAVRLGHLATALQARLEPGAGKRPGRPTDATWVHHPKVPMSDATVEKLTRLADLASTPERRMSPMQVAAQLLEDAVAECPTDLS